MDFLREPLHRPGSAVALNRRALRPLAFWREHPPIDLGVGSRRRTDYIGATGGAMCSLKEVIQPHLPVQLPCYDFVPVTKPDLGACLPCGLAQRLQSFSASMT